MNVLKFVTKSVCLLAVCFHIGAPLPVVNAEDWTRFRGENGAGISSDSRVPLSWSESENLKWKIDLPGPGFSSPIVISDKVFVTSYTGYGLNHQEPGDIQNLKRHLVCIDRNSGEILWTTDVPADLPEDPFSGPGVPTHGYASHTPTTDGEHVFVFFGKSGVMAFSLEGEKIWSTKVGSGSDPQAWGSAASPVLHGDLIIVNASAESSAIVALDKSAGSEVWRAERAGLQQTWSTPVIVEGEQGSELVVASPTEVWGLNPADGKLAWYATGPEARGMASSLIAKDGIVYCVGGMMGGESFAVKVGGKDDVSGANVLWTGRGLSQFGTGVVHDGHIFGISENGVAYCANAETGEVTYQARLATGEPVTEQAAPGGAQRAGARGQGNAESRGGARQGGRGSGGGMGSRSYGSSVLINENVYYTDQDGTTYVFAADPAKFQLIAKNQLGAAGDGFNATPAVSDGAIFIRSNKNLYCIAKP